MIFMTFLAAIAESANDGNGSDTTIEDEYVLPNDCESPTGPSPTRSERPVPADRSSLRSVSNDDIPLSVLVQKSPSKKSSKNNSIAGSRESLASNRSIQSNHSVASNQSAASLHSQKSTRSTASNRSIKSTSSRRSTASNRSEKPKPPPKPVKTPTPEPVKIATAEPVKLANPETVNARSPTPELVKSPTPQPEPIIDQVKEKPVASGVEQVILSEKPVTEEPQVLDTSPSEISENFSDPEDEITEEPKSVSDENLNSNQESPKSQRKVVEAVVEPEKPVDVEKVIEPITEPVKLDPPVSEPAANVSLPVSEPEVLKSPVSTIEPENLPVEKLETTLTETIETTIITETTVKSSPVKIDGSGDAKQVESEKPVEPKNPVTKSEEIPKSSILDPAQIEMSSDLDQEQVADKKSGK